MTRIIFELDEIEDLKNRLESVIQRGQKIESSDVKKFIKQNQTAIGEVLDEYEEKVFEYIRNNPGASNQDVVNALEGSRSRGPVYKIIKNLVEYGLVIERSDDTNARRHQLFENMENLILRVENDIKNFKRSYLKLIKRANLEQQRKQNLKSDNVSGVDPAIHSAMVDVDLTGILQQLIKGYSLKAIFEWPEEIKDSESLNRLYLMVFHMLGDIFSEHVKYSFRLVLKMRTRELHFFMRVCRIDLGDHLGNQQSIGN